jgi:uncharacterized membrane protein
MQKEYLIEIEDAVIAVKQQSGRVKRRFAWGSLAAVAVGIACFVFHGLREDQGESSVNENENAPEAQL